MGGANFYGSCDPGFLCIQTSERTTTHKSVASRAGSNEISKGVRSTFPSGYNVIGSTGSISAVRADIVISLEGLLT
jgi:hypothetical protein